MKNEYQLLNKEKMQVTIKFINWKTKIKKISINARHDEKVFEGVEF